MTMPSNQDMQTALLSEHVRRLMTIMGHGAVSVTCKTQELPAFKPEDPNVIGFNIIISTETDSRLLIGPQGNHLAALQHIIRVLLRRHLPQNVPISVDVNDYRARRERVLVQLAQTTAARALRTGQTVALQPMGAAERRTIHTALASRSDLHTESRGSEPNRRVIIRPVFL